MPISLFQKPVDSGADMNAFAFYHNITCRGHGYERQVVTTQCRRGFHKRARLAVEGFCAVDVVCHLYQLHGLVLVAHHKIHLFGARRLFVVVYVQEVVATPTKQFYIDNILQTPTNIFGRKRIFTIVLQPTIHDIRLGVSYALFALEGVLGKQLYEKCLAQITDVFLCRLIRYLQHFRDAIVVDLLAHIVDQVVGYFPQGVRVADFETLLYVFCDDGLHEALYVSTLIAQVLHFRKPPSLI